ncbi:MAG: ACT domain-containing protein [Firmicutes bacterium]|nr:ACT domain-containing protein [Bacillota bacterium]
MRVKQISVFLENRPGRLHEVTSALAEQNINIRALSIADTTEFGILRLIVDRPTDAAAALQHRGFTVSETDVIGVEIPDKPGGLAGVLKHMADAKINIEYLYAFLGKASIDALVLFRVDDMDRAVKVLQDNGVRVLRAEEMYRL